MRGLKQTQDGDQRRKDAVASFTDAWIETKCKLNVYILLSVASFTDAWIETTQTLETTTTSSVASFTDAWIETK